MSSPISIAWTNELYGDEPARHGLRRGRIDRISDLALAARPIAGEYQLDTTVFTTTKEDDLVDAIRSHEAVGDVVARQSVLARVFEEASIDYCYGNKKTLREACRERVGSPLGRAAGRPVFSPGGLYRRLAALSRLFHRDQGRALQG